MGDWLARSGHEVTFIARGPHLGGIQERGLRVESQLDGDFTAPGTATDDTTTPGVQDLVLFTVKMHQNQQAIPAVAPLVGPGTVVLTLQNGIDNGEQLTRTLGQEPVMIGSVYMEGRIKAPGVVTQGGPGRAVFGELAPGLTDRGKSLLLEFEKAGWRVELAENMPGMLWKKFAYIVGSAGVNAATNTDYGEMRSVPENQGVDRRSHLGVSGGGPCAGSPGYGRLPGVGNDGPGQLPRDRPGVPGQGLSGREPGGTGGSQRRCGALGKAGRSSHSFERCNLRDFEALGVAD